QLAMEPVLWPEGPERGGDLGEPIEALVPGEGLERGGAVALELLAANSLPGGLSGGRAHSITWSACCRSDWGIVRPRTFAVLRLRTNSNVVGCSMGRSPGFAPFRILSTRIAARRHSSRRFGP